MKLLIFLGAVATFFSAFQCSPLPSDSSLVVASTVPPIKDGESTYPMKPPKVILQPDIYQMDIYSNISNRFATTLVTSKVRNPASTDQEATFSVVLPEKAFISQFVMEIGGKSYKAYVKEKEEAKKIYEEAKESGLSAAHVAVSARDSNRFTVSVNVEPESKATFYLTYEELLERNFGQYELVLNIHPGQIVKDLNIEVHINESQPLKFVKTPSLRSGNEISKEDDKNDLATNIEIVNGTSAVVKFKPGPEEQQKFEKELNAKEGTGISGQMVVQYDVERNTDGGEILLNDGYFVHFFSSEEKEPLPKQIIFVLDTSGSMSGNKISQLREAMASILDQIKGDNLLSVVDFSWNAKVWDIGEKISKDIEGNITEVDLPLSVATTEQAIKNAKEMAATLEATGSTSMLAGLTVAIELTKRIQKKEGDKYQPLIVLLTDGQPTDAVADEIVEKITKLNNENKQAAIFSLSFGDYADKNFLRKLSSKNSGYSKHIYEAADASLQLEKFYKQIASPLLANLQFKYTSEAENLTQTVFPLYFGGGEFIICGVFDGKPEDLDPTVNSKSIDGVILKRPHVMRTISPLERHWVYLTIKQILEERKSAESKEELTKKALDLALKYSLVTDVTSLVVVKPNATSAVETQDAASGVPPPAPLWGNRAQSIAFSRVQPLSAHHTSLMTFGKRLIVNGGPSFGIGGGAAYAAQSFASPPQAFPVPVAESAFISTTLPSTTENPALEDTLTWLKPFLRANRTIDLPQGTFELGENIDTGLLPEVSCNSSLVIKGQEGLCIPLWSCSEAENNINSLAEYLHYFCSLQGNKVAGVCCRPKLGPIP